MQRGTKNYLPFQDQEPIRMGYKLELLRRHNKFVQNQITERKIVKSVQKRLIEQNRLRLFDWKCHSY